MSFTFPAGTIIAAGKAIVVLHFDPSHPSNASLVSAFRSFYGVGSSVPLYGPYSGVLDNGGNTVRLERPDVPVGGTTPYVLVDEATFATQPPWPAAANGQGASLNRRGTTSFGDIVGSWASAAPTPGSFTIDATPPTVAIAAVTPNPRGTPIDSIAINFSEPVAGVTLASLSLSRDGGTNLLTGGSPTLTTTDNVTWILGNLTGLTGALGTYTLTLNATGSGITDLAGNPLVNGATGGFTVVVPQWKGPSGGSFNTASNWSDGNVPNATDAVARFLSGAFGITGPAVITIDSPVTLGSIIFDSANSYTLSGTAGITFSSSTAPQVSVLSGNQTILGTLALSGSTTVANGAGLTVGGLQASALVIGGGALVTIAPSSAGGDAIASGSSTTQVISTGSANANGQLSASSSTVSASRMGADAAGPAVDSTSTMETGSGSQMNARGIGSNVSAAPTESLSSTTDANVRFNDTNSAGPDLRTVIVSVQAESSSRPTVAAIDHLLGSSTGESPVPAHWIRWHRQPSNSAAAMQQAHDQALLDLLSSNDWRLPSE